MQLKQIKSRTPFVSSSHTEKGPKGEKSGDLADHTVGPHRQFNDRRSNCPNSYSRLCRKKEELHPVGV